ncbi:haloacid dehalogenase [Rickenella mellea]|uniref:Haloacid dehalogenase n=1 Tax=Rickenella mellea TaxID=50990 RepID=A0A4Y7Q1Y1_9AGAM|nr:haloacid dehalogenase [Rickenella mellea]
MSTISPTNPLDGVEALTFDVFGTVVDWHGTGTRALQDTAERMGLNAEEDWSAFAKEWRDGYIQNTRAIAQGGQASEGALNLDVLHREILDNMFTTPRWAHLSSAFDDKIRGELVMIWHRLNGWPDSSEGLYALKKRFIITTLSNGNVRLLVDMAKYANLPWDVIFSGELLGGYKPNPKTYLGAAHHLSLPPSKVTMVAAHIHDLRSAALHGMKTVYVRRPTEDGGLQEAVKPKSEGGEVDLVMDSFVELARALGCT